MSRFCVYATHAFAHHRFTSTKNPGVDVRWLRLKEGLNAAQGPAPTLNCIFFLDYKCEFPFMFFKGLYRSNAQGIYPCLFNIRETIRDLDNFLINFHDIAQAGLCLDFFFLCNPSSNLSWTSS
jgi:hypothetical protein